MKNFVLLIIAAAVLVPTTASAQKPDERFPGGSPARGQGQISLRVDPAAFSPNDDGKQDSTFFFIGTQGVPELSKWAVTLENAHSRTVRRFSGHGSPPGLMEWNGANAKNARAPEGIYTAKATLWGKGGKTSSSQIKVALDNTPPRVRISLSTRTFSPEDPSSDVTISLTGEDNAAPTSWALAIFIQGHADVEVFSASGAFAGGSAALTWNGINPGTGEPVPNGVYTVHATAQDAAGNEASAPNADVEVVVRPESILKLLSQTFVVSTSTEDLTIAIPSVHLFDHKYSADFSAGSGALRQRLLYLIQSFPDRDVLIEGRAGSEKTAVQRTDLSSAQAWALYSSLVKSGVAATRLSVHGAGGVHGEENRITLLFRAANPQGTDVFSIPAIAGPGVSSSTSSIPSGQTGAHP